MFGIAVAWVGGPNEDIDPVDDYSTFGQALRQYGTKLVRLMIRRSELDDDEKRHRTPLVSLAELTSLRELALSFEALYGDESQLNDRPTWLQENLPLSLEALVIEHVVHTKLQIVDEQLRRMINDKRFSALKRFHRMPKTIREHREDEDEDSTEDEDENSTEDEDEGRA